MRSLTTLLITLLLSAPVMVDASQRVSGYTKKNGTYVAPHRRSDADSSRNNNWSKKGNTNPYTGKRGTKK